MSVLFRPSSVDELCEVVRDAAGAGRRLEIVSNGSRRGVGRPLQADAVLDLSAFSGVSVYEPEELVLTCGAATPLAEIEELLGRNGQHMAFEPPDFGPMWGLPLDQGTIGGALSVGLGGSARFVHGAPRDHFLGFKAVNGYGEAFAAGGRVVKNVTGYDLPKLMAGAYGTLGAMTEVTIKVLPRAPASHTLAVIGGDEANVLAALLGTMQEAHPITAAALLPAQNPEDFPVLLVRLESIPAVVAAHVETARMAFLAAGCKDLELAPEKADALWRLVGSGGWLQGDAPVWRLSIPPSTAAAVGAALRRAGAGRLYYDWGGGAIWVEWPEADDGGAQAVRQVLRDVAGDGHATLMRGSSDLRARIEVFEPMNTVLTALTGRVKAQFDASGVFNFGRMYEGL